MSHSLCLTLSVSLSLSHSLTLSLSLPLSQSLSLTLSLFLTLPLSNSVSLSLSLSQYVPLTLCFYLSKAVLKNPVLKKGKTFFFIIQFDINFMNNFLYCNLDKMLLKILHLCFFIILPMTSSESIGENDFNYLLYRKLVEHLSLNLY
jgi:hypothetical protein